ncbi:MAG: hypothetical protein ABIR87_06990 [Sphingomicrobium sp.]
MIRTVATLALMACLAACVASDPKVGLPYTLIDHDDGSASGVWDGGGLVLTLDLSIGTFAAQSGCTISGGTLTAVGAGRYRIGRYESGYSTDRCGPWKNGPAIAPFDGNEVSIIRNGERLTVSGPTRTLALKRRHAR